MPPLPDRSGRGWRWVQSGETPRLIHGGPPRPRIEAVSHCRHELVELLCRIRALFFFTRSAFLGHERAKGELKALIPDNDNEAFGHRIRARRSKAITVSFDLLETGSPPVPRSNDTVAAPASAKAKAELVNPKKSLTVTIRGARPVTQNAPSAMPRSRAGSTLSAARGIARPDHRHGPPDRDPMNLTTALAHASGE